MTNEFKIGQPVRCICPPHKTDIHGTHNKIGRIIEGLERRLVGAVFVRCYVVEIAGTPYNALPEWLESVAIARSPRSGSVDDDFFGVTGKL